MEHIANEAGLLAVKEAIANNIPAETVNVCVHHFRQAIGSIMKYARTASSTVPLIA